MGNIKNEQNCNVSCEKKSSSAQKKPAVGFLKWRLLITGLYSATAVSLLWAGGLPCGAWEREYCRGIFCFLDAVC